MGYCMNKPMEYDVENLKTITGAIILAGGLGERLKAVGLKPFLWYRGKSFLQIAVENIKSIGLSPLVIVANELSHQKIVALKLPAKILINHHPEHGMLSSILIGLQEIESSCGGFFLCSIDYPLVLPTTFQKLLLAHQSNPDRIIKPVFNNQPGHPVVIPKNLFQALHNAPLDQGARFVIRQWAHLTLNIAVDDPGILININTPELYYQHCK